MQFKDIEGQHVLANKLTEIIDSGRISHAQMFLGPTASGSLAMAIAYAQYVGCTNRQHYGEGSLLRADSCGECPHCKKYRELAHPDLHFIFPNTTTSRVKGDSISSADFQGDWREFLAQHNQRGTEDKWYTHIGAENKQGLIRERDGANIVRTLSLKAYEGGQKVMIIWLAERMNPRTANELLKTIEEPTDNTLILLVVENRDRMLSTIISRVQQVVVPDLGGDFSTEKREKFATMFVNWTRLLFKLNMYNLSAWVDETAKLGREEQKQFLQYSQEAIRACFLKSVGGIELPGELNWGDEKFNTFFPTMITVRNVEQMNQAFTDAQRAIVQNAYGKITFMQLSFTLSKLIKNR